MTKKNCKRPRKVKLYFLCHVLQESDINDGWLIPSHRIQRFLFSRYFYLYFVASKLSNSVYSHWCREHPVFFDCSCRQYSDFTGPSSLYVASSLIQITLFYSLVIYDFVIGQPLFAVYTLAIACNDAELFCSVGLSYSLTAVFLALVSIWSLTVIALDRYLALILRFRYRAIVTVKWIVVVRVSGWLFIAFCTASITLGIQLRQII